MALKTCNLESLATTNIDPERDLEMLDCLMKLKTKALDLAYKENIMYVRNKTSEWRDKLSEEKPDKALDLPKNQKVNRWLCTLKTKK